MVELGVLLGISLDNLINEDAGCVFPFTLLHELLGGRLFICLFDGGKVYFWVYLLFFVEEFLAMLQSLDFCWWPLLLAWWWERLSCLDFVSSLQDLFRHVESIMTLVPLACFVMYDGSTGPPFDCGLDPLILHEFLPRRLKSLLIMLALSLLAFLRESRHLRLNWYFHSFSRRTSLCFLLLLRRGQLHIPLPRSRISRRRFIDPTNMLFWISFWCFLSTVIHQRLTKTVYRIAIVQIRLWFINRWQIRFLRICVILTQN